VSPFPYSTFGLADGSDIFGMWIRPYSIILAARVTGDKSLIPQTSDFFVCYPDRRAEPIRLKKSAGGLRLMGQSEPRRLKPGRIIQCRQLTLLSFSINALAVRNGRTHLSAIRRKRLASLDMNYPHSFARV